MANIYIYILYGNYQRRKIKMCTRNIFPKNYKPKNTITKITEKPERKNAKHLVTKT
jgi:hypothetical protein